MALLFVELFYEYIVSTIWAVSFVNVHCSLIIIALRALYPLFIFLSRFSFSLSYCTGMQACGTTYCVVSQRICVTLLAA